MENQHFNFGEKATITIDDILAIKNGEQVGFTVKGLASERNDYTVETIKSKIREYHGSKESN